jgi:hypothetical protein
MILTIELTPEQLERLKEAALARGVEPTVLLELIIDSLPLSTENGIVDTDNGSEGTFADLFQPGELGGFHSGCSKEQLSENHGKKFIEYLLEKREQGRL